MRLFFNFQQFSRDIKVFIIGVLVASCFGVYAAGTCIISATADDVTYGNTTVQAAIDELYSMSENNCPSGYICLKTLYGIMAKNAVLDDRVSTYVTNSTGIKFNAVSSDTNGKGIYEIASTKNDTYPIYYYRGAVTNNNVKFAGFCWKAVRTTDTGGVKLIYNGEPDQDGYCTNTTGTDTQIGTSQFNRHYASLANVGYMYGTRNVIYSSIGYASFGASTDLFGSGVSYSNGTYTLTNPSTISDWSTNYNNYVGYYTCSSSSSDCTSVKRITSASSSSYNYLTYSNGVTENSSVLYGGDVTYSGGTYTLSDTIPIKPSEWQTKYNTINNNHYTCFSLGTTCTSVYYIYYTTTSDAFYITLTNGKKVSDALDEMFSASNVNSTNSLIKTQIDNWYNTNLSNYTSYIEDNIYCNDRGISVLAGWNSDGGSTSNDLSFSSKTRTITNFMPSLICSRAQDRFTVSSTKGNGALTYPVGLITSDEIMYAGGKGSTSNSTYYLYTNQAYWTGSPYYFYYNGHANEYIVGSNGNLNSTPVNSEYGIRPVISLKPTLLVESGNGTSTNPYVIQTS